MILFRTAFMISMYLCRIYFDGSIFFLMIRRPPRSTRTDTLFPSRRSSDLVLAAKAAGIVALDQAVVEIRDDDQFRRDAEKGRDLGYEGKICVVPRQVEISNELFAPTAAEISHARELVAVYEDATRRGLGTIDRSEEHTSELQSLMRI